MQKSIWWCFLLAFAVVIGGIHSFGWWTRSASAESPVCQTTTAPAALAVAQALHWRDLLMQK